MEWTVEVERQVSPVVISPTKVLAMAGCGYRVHLESIITQERRGAWWFVGGRAFASFKQDFETEVHTGSQSSMDVPWPSAQWARRQFFQRFGEEIEAARQTDGPPEEWLSANKRTEDGSWWAQAGPRMAELYVERNPPDRPFSTLVLPDGSLGLEVGITTVLGDRIVTGRIDHLTLDTSGYVDIQDDKSGARWPEDPFQLEMYAVMIERWLNVRVARLHYYIARELPKKTKVSRTDFLITKQWLPERTASVVERVDRTAKHIEDQKFLPVVSNLCKGCGVRRHCAFGGTSQEIL
jgi:hypothetical protein